MRNMGLLMAYSGVVMAVQVNGNRSGRATVNCENNARFRVDTELYVCEYLPRRMNTETALVLCQERIEIVAGEYEDKSLSAAASAGDVEDVQHI